MALHSGLSLFVSITIISLLTTDSEVGLCSQTIHSEDLATTSMFCPAETHTLCFHQFIVLRRIASTLGCIVSVYSSRYNGCQSITHIVSGCGVTMFIDNSL